MLVVTLGQIYLFADKKLAFSIQVDCDLGEFHMRLFKLSEIAFFVGCLSMRPIVYGCSISHLFKYNVIYLELSL